MTHHNPSIVRVQIAIVCIMFTVDMLEVPLEIVQNGTVFVRTVSERGNASAKEVHSSADEGRLKDVTNAPRREGTGKEKDKDCTSLSLLLYYCYSGICTNQYNTSPSILPNSTRNSLPHTSPIIICSNTYTRCERRDVGF